jgi:nucleotide-binding universal stress UspA family protein
MTVRNVDTSMYDRILVPTDGSSDADRAVEHALDLAETYGADLYVLYVVDTNVLPLDPRTQQVAGYLEEAGRRAEAKVLERASGRDVDTVVTDVLEGSPHEVILEYADDNDVDLLVMGTHGRRGLDRVLLGSVTQRVLRTADVPVLVVRPPSDDEA